jgi:NAD dependent epimerase/dehydratase family enzyme
MKWSDRIQFVFVVLAVTTYFTAGGNWPWIFLLFALFVGFTLGECQAWQAWVEGAAYIATIILLVLVKNDWVDTIAMVLTAIISLFVNCGDFLQGLSKAKNKGGMG